MHRKWTTIILTIIFLLLKAHSQVQAGSNNIHLISPTNGITLSTTNIQFQWRNDDRYEEYMYMLCITDDIVEGTRYCEIPSSKTNATLDITNTKGYIYWFVAYQKKSQYIQNIAKYTQNPSLTFNQYSSISIFGINTTVPYSLKNLIAGKSPGDFFRPNDQIKNPDGTTTLVCRNKWVFKLSSEYFSPQDTAVQWNINRESGEVLGETTSIAIPPEVLCHFKSVIEENTTRTTKDFCRMYNLISVQSEKDVSKNPNILNVTGKYYEYTKIQIDVYQCVKNFFNPLSWFRCQEKYVKTLTLDYPLEKEFEVFTGNINLQSKQVTAENGSFALNSSIDPRNNEAITLKVAFTLNFPYYNISEQAISTYILNPVIVNNNPPKPFSFPFNKIIGVTQWHGYTAYQSPHTGIDFGSYLENVLSSDNGIVVAKGYDTYYGECNSGGNYLIIKNSNDMYTVYFHLAQSYVNIGDSVAKNQVVAQSGNSGKSECKPLGYHLHFETRKDRSQNSHDDPVKYVDIDWNLVSTLDATKIPARLSGDNPHPEK